MGGIKLRATPSSKSAVAPIRAETGISNDMERIKVDLSGIKKVVAAIESECNDARGSEKIEEIISNDEAEYNVCYSRYSLSYSLTFPIGERSFRFIYSLFEKGFPYLLLLCLYL